MKNVEPEDIKDGYELIKKIIVLTEKEAAHLATLYVDAFGKEEILNEYYGCWVW